MSTTTTHLMTAEELADLDDDSHRHELIKGELLTMTPPKREHARVCANLIILLGNYVKANDLGEVWADSGFKLESNPDTVIAPDLSFNAKNRLTNLPTGYVPGPPDLAVEVRSPGDRRGKVERKSTMWLGFGIKSLWVVNPIKRSVEVFHSTGKRSLFHESDELIDDTVPGFRVAVSKIFE
jgi:Uma2 family endonuclease